MAEQNQDRQKQVRPKYWMCFLYSFLAYIFIAAVLFWLLSITFEHVAFKKKAIAALLLMNLGVTIIIVFKFRFTGFVVMRLLIPILSVIAGAVLGGMTNPLYSIFDQTPIGLYSGGIIGLLAGVCFCAIIINKCQKKKELSGKFIITAGIVTGIISSTLVHLVMMIAYDIYIPIGVAIGLPFGGIAGAVLGKIADSFISRSSMDSGQADHADSILGDSCDEKF